MITERFFLDILVSACLLSVVVPCYNEEQVIDTCHESLTRVLSQAIGDYQIVYVNDGSTDSTYQLLREMQSADARVKVVDLARNFGHQIAVSAGLAYAEGDAVALIDADLQDPPEVLVQMVDLWKQGYEVVFGVRKTRAGESWFKLKSAEWFYRILNLLSDTEIPRDTGDFRLLDRKLWTRYCECLSGTGCSEDFPVGLGFAVTVSNMSAFPVWLA
jgi:Glycosyltransferases involved in cell wall biogenesis